MSEQSKCSFCVGRTLLSAAVGVVLDPVLGLVLDLGFVLDQARVGRTLLSAAVAVVLVLDLGLVFDLVLDVGFDSDFWRTRMSILLTLATVPARR
jgi:hypothetical protein